jgi:rubrerythrin
VERLKQLDKRMVKSVIDDMNEISVIRTENAALREKVEKLKGQKWYFDIENHTCLTCGGVFDLPENMFRCIDCGAFLHKFCMAKHCGR